MLLALLPDLSPKKSLTEIAKTVRAEFRNEVGGGGGAGGQRRQGWGHQAPKTLGKTQNVDKLNKRKQFQLVVEFETWREGPAVDFLCQHFFRLGGGGKAPDRTGP